MSVTEYIRELMAKGFTVEQALTAAEVYEANPPKSKAAVRQKRYRDGKRNETSRGTANVTETAPDKEIPHTPLEINPTPPSPPKGGSVPPSGNPAALPSDLDQLQAKLLDAAGISNFREERSVGLVSVAPILGLIQQGYSLESDILPVIRDISRRGKKPNSWAYFVPSIIEAATAKRSIPAKPKAPEVDWPQVLAAFRSQGIWYEQRYGPRPGEPKCRVPPEFLMSAA